MEIFINIDGVLRNLIQKFRYHYTEEFMYDDLHPNESEESENNIPFEYEISYPIENNNLLKSFRFHDVSEYENFKFIELPLEIYGHAGLSYPRVITDFNNLIYEQNTHNFTVIGLDEFGKAKPSTLFFLSKNGFLGNNIRFITTDEIKETWKKCDLWITDNIDVVNLKPRNKKCLFFETEYNKTIKTRKKLNKITSLKEIEL